MSRLADAVPGAPVLAAWHNTNRDRTVVPFTNAAQRATEIPTPTEGMVAYLADTNRIEVYDGAAWVASGPRVLAYLDSTSTQSSIGTTATDITGVATPSLTIPAGRRIKLTASCMFGAGGSDTNAQLIIADSAGTQLQAAIVNVAASSFATATATVLVMPSAGSYVWKARANALAGLINVVAGSGVHTVLIVEDVGGV